MRIARRFSAGIAVNENGESPCLSGPTILTFCGTRVRSFPLWQKVSMSALLVRSSSSSKTVSARPGSTALRVSIFAIWFVGILSAMRNGSGLRFAMN